MVLSLVTVIRLCWFLCFFLPFVQGQFPGNGFGGQNQFNPPNGGGGGFGGVGNGFGNGGFRPGGGGGGGFGGGGGGFRGGGFRNGENNEFGNGREGGFSAPQEGNGNTQEEEPKTTSAQAQPAETEPAQEVAPAPSSAPPSTLIALVPSSTAAPPASVFVPPPSSLSAAIPVASPSSSVVPSIPVGSILTPLVPVPASTLVPAISSALPAPSAVPDSIAPEDEDVPAPVAPEESSTVDPAPLSTSSGGTSNASAQAGMGIGITFAVLSVAGAAGFYLWRRRQARKEDRDAVYPGGNQWKSFFGFDKRKDGKDDPEWSIESAEKVAILKGGSAKSVSTTRSDSRGSDSSITSPLAAPVPAALPSNRGVRPSEQIMKVGMKVTQRPSNPALQSNPPSPPDIATMFPRPPSGSGSASVKSDKADKLGTETKSDKETKTSSWPLPD